MESSGVAVEEVLGARAACGGRVVAGAAHHAEEVGGACVEASCAAVGVSRHCALQTQSNATGKQDYYLDAMV